MGNFNIHQVTNIVNTLSTKNFEEVKNSNAVDVVGEVASDVEIQEIVSAMQRGHLYTQATYMGTTSTDESELVQAGPILACEVYDELVKASRNS